MKQLKKIGEYFLAFLGITSGLWLTYYPLHWLNQLGLLLRGPLLNELSGNYDKIDELMHTTSSLGILSFLVGGFILFAYFESQE